MKTIWKWNKEYENGRKSFETWKLYETIWKWRKQYNMKMGDHNLFGTSGGCVLAVSVVVE